MSRDLPANGLLAALACGAVLGACATPDAAPERDALRRQVIETEQAFAGTMATRDLAAFADFIAEEAVFLDDDRPLRGKRAVVEHWAKYFEKAEAPFSWAPGSVEVLDSGSLALSTGPVYDAKGRRVATFTSVWRREDSGRWRIVFDKGDDACNRP